MQPTIRRVKGIHDLSLEVLDWEGEGPPRVFLHGFGHDAHVWDAFLPAADGRRALALSQRGHGASDRDARGRYSHEVMALDLAAVLDELAIDELELVGHSMGGYNALHFAHAHPERIQGLVLVDVSPELSPEALVRGLTRRSQSVRFDEVDESMLEMRPDVEDWCRRESAFLWEALSGARCSVHLIRGARSSILHSEIAERMVTECGVKLSTVSEAGHAVMLDNAEGFRRALGLQAGPERSVMDSSAGSET